MSNFIPHNKKSLLQSYQHHPGNKSPFKPKLPQMKVPTVASGGRTTQSFHVFDANNSQVINYPGKQVQGQKTFRDFWWKMAYRKTTTYQSKILFTSQRIVSVAFPPILTG